MPELVPLRFFELFSITLHHHHQSIIRLQRDASDEQPSNSLKRGSEINSSFTHAHRKFLLPGLKYFRGTPTQSRCTEPLYIIFQDIKMEI